jgi:two-component system sensor histidine kinase CpxA
MLVSSPLLLWLAWSLAKPARKLKNAADEVAQGNLRQHPELESGRRSSWPPGPVLTRW